MHRTDGSKCSTNDNGRRVAGVGPNGASCGRGDYFDTWQPYSDPDLWFGASTIQTDRIFYETGPRAGLAPVRDDGSVFRLVDPQGGVFNDCGNEATNYIGFHVLCNGMLAVLHYRHNTPPREPVGNYALQVIQNDAVQGTCSVAFFTR